MRSLGRSFALWLERSSLGSGFGGYKYRVRFTSSMYIFISKSSRIGSSALLPSACGPEVNDADEEELDVLEELDELDEEEEEEEVDEEDEVDEVDEPEDADDADEFEERADDSPSFVDDLTSSNAKTSRDFPEGEELLLDAFSTPADTEEAEETDDAVEAVDVDDFDETAEEEDSDDRAESM